jgi:hypothetical protein
MSSLLKTIAAQRLAKSRKTNRGISLEAFAARFKDDFVGFCAVVDIVPKSGVKQKLILNSIQERYCAARTARDVVLKPRQIGFTTMEQARDIWFLLTRPGARVVAMCQSVTDHAPLAELSQNYDTMFASLADYGLKLTFGTDSRAAWRLPDGRSLKIIEAGASQAAAQKKGRAGTINRLHITEVAFWEYAEDTLNAILECVPGPETGSEIVSESTANGAAGTFYQQYQHAVAGRSGYAPHFFRWFDLPSYRTELDPGEHVSPDSPRERELVASHRVSPEQLKWYRQKVADKSQDLVDQEYPSDAQRCFLVSGRTFLTRDITEKLITAASAPIETSPDGALRIWSQPQRGTGYVISADPSEGTGGDPGAAIVYTRNGEHVATLHGQFAPWDFARELAKIGTRFNGALLVVERNNHGGAVLQALVQNIKYPSVYRDADGKYGWNTTGPSRAMALEAFQDAHHKGHWTTCDVSLLGECRTFVVKDGKPQAANGAHDDLVMASVIGWATLTRPIAVTNRSLPTGFVA